MSKFVAAIAVIALFSVSADSCSAGWWWHRHCCPIVRCRPVVVNPVVVQPEPVALPVATGVVVRRGLFGRVVIQPGLPVCSGGTCTPPTVQPLPNPDPGPSVKVDAPGVEVEVK